MPAAAVRGKVNLCEIRVTTVCTARWLSAISAIDSHSRVRDIVHMSSPTLVVLAAGMGARFGGLKQVAPIGPAGETLLDYSIFDARRSGFDRVVFVIRREIEAEFRAAVGDRYANRLEVRYAHQRLDDLPAGHTPPSGRTKPWGTGHAVLAARAAVGANPFAVINADDFYGAGAYRALIQFFTAAGSPVEPPRCALVAFRLGQTLSEHGAVSRGVCRLDAGGRLLAIDEMTGIEWHANGARGRQGDGTWRHLAADTPVSVNCWGLPAALFAPLEAKFARFLAQHGRDPSAEFFLPTAVSELAHEKVVRIELLHSADPWLGITYREDVPAVRTRLAALIQSGAYPPSLA